MKILLLGKNGQVGWALQRALAPLGSITVLDRTGAPGLCGDLADLEGLRATIRTLEPDVLVNAAAYTAVDKAETQGQLAELINAAAPALMAEEMQRLNGWLVHYSTDYVFSGTGTAAWQETDTPAPLNHYGKTKWQGEQAIARAVDKYLIFRTSWVYAARGTNFAKTILGLAQQREVLNIIADQIGAPTGAELIADITAHALLQSYVGRAPGGIYHLAASGTTSWHGYAALVLEIAKMAGAHIKVQELQAIHTDQYPTPARRPLNSRLNCTKLATTFGLVLPDWQSGVRRMVHELQGTGSET